MSESDTMFNERDQRCAAVQLMLSTDPSYDNNARGVMVIVVGIGHGDTSSNPGLIAFHIALIPLGKV